MKKSNSMEQTEAEKYIFSEIQKELGVSLYKNPKVPIVGNTYIQPDFYSDEHRIIGEIFAHCGNLKVGQKHKIANDILKMLLLEKVTGYRFVKVFVVCDEEVYHSLQGYSALAESFTQFDIKLKYIELDEANRKNVLLAQKRQVMING